jgi:hypothetical protein
LEIIVILQRLDLIAPSLRLPNPLQLSPKSLLRLFIPSTPTTWTFRSTLGFLFSILFSPVSLHISLSFLSIHLERLLARYTWSLLPRPGSPDTSSQRGLALGISTGENSSFVRRMPPESFTSEFRKDYQILVSKVKTLRSYIDFTPLKRLGTIFYPAPSLAPQQQPTEAPPQPPSLLPQSANTIQTNPVSIPSPSSTATPSPTLSTSSSFQAPLNNSRPDSSEPPTVQVTTRTGSTDTLHMSVEVLPTTSGAPIFTSSFSASPRPSVAVEIDTTHFEIVEDKYRVTGLTLRPSEALAQLIGCTLSRIILLPLESYVLRRIASGYLQSAIPTPGVDFLTTMVYPSGSWGGVELRRGGWRGVGDYVGKLGLCVAVEGAIGFGIWQVMFTVVWRMGRRWYNWGKL